MTESKLSVGCAGAGLLGSAIMRRLLQQGFPLSVWNRTRERLAPLVHQGAQPADSPAELARRSEIVLTCVTDGAAVEAIVFGPEGVASGGAPGKLLVDMSTMNADHTRRLAARLKERCGMRWLDAPISGGPPAALEGRMAVMVGGAKSDFEAAGPLWDALAGRSTLMGAIGAGQAAKMVNQVLVACTVAVLAEAYGLAVRTGVDPALIPQALAGGRADSRLLQEYMPKMAASDFAPTGSLGIMLKDLEMIQELAGAVGAPMPVTALVTELHRTLVLADGLGDRDPSEFVRPYRPSP